MGSFVVRFVCLYSAYVQEDSAAAIWISEALLGFYSWDVASKIGHMHHYKVEDDLYIRWQMGCL